MKRLIIFASVIAIAAISAALAARSHKTPFEPGARTLLLAHNAFPDKDLKYKDRLHHALSAGLPFAAMKTWFGSTANPCSSTTSSRRARTRRPSKVTLEKFGYIEARYPLRMTRITQAWAR